MPKSITNVNDLQGYLKGVIYRADHHAPEVEEIALAVFGAIVWKKDIDEIKVMEQDGDMKNVLWVIMSGNKYAFSYNHKDKTIEMRKGTTRGIVIKAFDNSNTCADVLNFFKDL